MALTLSKSLAWERVDKRQDASGAPKGCRLAKDMATPTAQPR